MAVGFDVALTNARGLGKLVFFRGLRFPMVMVPSIMGEPMLTAQPFYLFERLDSVARVRFEDRNSAPTVREIESVIDNYLYEYSKKYPDSQITTKTAEFPYWDVSPEEHRFDVDWRHTTCLVLDPANDPTIVQCSYPGHPDKETIYDWCLFRPYFEAALEEYRQKLQQALDMRVHVETKGHPSLGTGRFNLPIAQVYGNLMTLNQVELFETIEPDRYQNGTRYLVSHGIPDPSTFYVNQEFFDVSEYREEQLLAYYFSALRDHSPLSQFKNFYNVLEYFFEDAPTVLRIQARTEREQIESVLRWVVTPSALISRLHALPKQALEALARPRTTSSGEVVTGLNLSSPDIVGEYAAHIYQVRNACIHSKKTRKGLPTPRIAPSTFEESILSDEMPVMQWLATKCIDK
jgi:hypothetical protein